MLVAGLQFSGGEKAVADKLWVNVHRAASLAV
jgi:hypothetical protein